MSIPEAPFDGEAHARKEGAWIQAYGKTALDAFVGLCRSFFDGCRHYHDETKKLYDATVALLATYVKEASVDGKIYGRKNKGWVAIPTGGGGGGAPRVSVIEAMEWTTLTTDADVVMFIPPGGDDTGYSHVTVELPSPTADCAINLLVGPTWTHDPTGLLLVEIRLRISTDENSADHRIVYSGGNGSEVVLGFKMDYMMVFHEGKWYITDAMPAQPR
jgi:hypothetical protein